MGITRILVSPEDENAAKFYYHVGFTDFTKGLCMEFSHPQLSKMDRHAERS